jgi:protein arginine N-methyltransferase 1
VDDIHSIHSLGRMMADRLRTEPYVQALQQSVHPGSVVLNIGTGAGGQALLACKLGARRVYAIEPGDSIEVARAVARDNGFEDRIEFIQANSTDVTLPEPVDVIVSELRGAVPLHEGRLHSLMDARDRFLAPGGVLIPLREDLRVAVVEAPDLYGRVVDAWDHNPLGLDMSSARQLMLNAVHWGTVGHDQLLTGGPVWATLDYATLKEEIARGNVTLPVTRPGVGHGLVHWFDATLVEGIGFSVGPSHPDDLPRRGPFLPWSHPVELAAGDEVRVELAADRLGDDYVWTWRTQVMDGQAEPSVKAEFGQSTFFSSHPLSRRWLRNRPSEPVSS